MNYFEKRYIFYTEILKQISDVPESNIAFKIAEVFCLDDKTVTFLNGLRSDKTYKKLQSSDMIKIHLAAVNTFCKGKGFFGETSNEKSVLESKCRALEITENAEITNCEEVFSSGRLNDPVSVFVGSLLRVFRNQPVEENTLKAYVGRGSRDAGLLSAYLFEKTRTETIAALYRLGLFSKEEADILLNRYSLKKEDLKSVKSFSLGFGGNSEKLGF